jgi:hypothetical protein
VRWTSRTSGGLYLAVTGCALLAIGLAGCGSRQQVATGAGPAVTAPAPPSTTTAPATTEPATTTRQPATTTRQPATTTRQPGSTTTGPPVTATSPLVGPQDGQYSDGPEGSPRYLISLRHIGSSSMTGSVTFIYQDGRTQVVATYTGRADQRGPLSMALDDQRTLTGTYSARQLDFPACGAVLAWAVKAQQCTFAYDG